MRLIIGGTIRVPEEHIETLKPHIQALMAATQAEAGCEVFVFTKDLADPGLIRLFEIWRDQAALDQHLTSPHIVEWRRIGAQYGVSDRRLTIYDIAGERPF